MAFSTTRAPGLLLAVIGRRAAFVTTGATAIGINWPDLARLLEPVLLPAAGVLVFGAFLSASYSVERGWFQRHTPLAMVWSALAPACIVTPSLALLDLEASIGLGIALTCMAPPAGTVPSFAALLNLSPKLALITFVATTLAAPLTLPLLTQLFGIDLRLDFWDLTIRVSAAIGFGGIAAMVVRTNQGRLTWLIPGQSAATGLSAIGASLHFAAAGALLRVQLSQQSIPFVELLAIALGVGAFLVVIGTITFLYFGAKDAITVGLLSGYRNTGLMWGIVIGRVPMQTEAFLATALVVLSLMPITVQLIGRLTALKRGARAGRGAVVPLPASLPSGVR